MQPRVSVPGWQTLRKASDETVTTARPQERSMQRCGENGRSSDQAHGRARMGLFDRLRKTHEVTVNFVQAPNVPSYFVAICECGWLGDFHDLEQPAFADAKEHHP